MVNQLSSSGLTVKTLAEIVSDLEDGFREIYGDDVNLDQNSPDGQIINIVAQAIRDNLELLVDVYNSFSPASAYGVVLGQRLALNGMTRQAGTYTYTPVSVTVDQALTLNGLDALDADPTAEVFTVYDDAGQDFYLVETQSPAVAGTSSYSFRAKDVGNIQTTVNTITNQRTAVLGVTAVNNPAVASSSGVDEETDSAFKVRQAAMFQLAAVGPSDAIRAALLEVDDVSDAYVVENETGGVVGGVPAHSVWAIVNGGTDADVANAIYMKKAPGCGMFGSQTYVVARPQGNSMSISFDRAVAQNLYVQFGLSPRYTGATWNDAEVKTSLAAALSYTINQQANVGDIVSALLEIVPQAFAVSLGVSTDGLSYTDTVSPTTAQKYFVAAAARISVI